MSNVVRFKPDGPLKRYADGAKRRYSKQERAKLREIVGQLALEELKNPSWEWDGGIKITIEEITKRMYGDYPMEENFNGVWRWLWQSFKKHEWSMIRAEHKELMLKEVYVLTQDFVKRYSDKTRRPRTEQQMIQTIRHSGNKKGFAILICNNDHPLFALGLEQGMASFTKAAENMKRKLSKEKQLTDKTGTSNP